MDNFILAFLIHFLKDSSEYWRDDENLGKLMYKVKIDI